PERQAMLRQHLSAELTRIMGIDPGELDLDQPLNSIGMDSLMAMELKTVLESRLGITVPMARFFSGPSVSSLADDAANLIAAADGAPSDGNGHRNGQLAPSWSPLVLLERGEDKPPLFCLHPI